MNLTHTNIITEGQDAHAVAVRVGLDNTLGAENALTTNGDGAIGIYATGGGVVNGTGGVVTITTSGTNSEATGLSAYGVNADGPGSQVNLRRANSDDGGGERLRPLRQRRRARSTLRTRRASPLTDWRDRGLRLGRWLVDRRWRRRDD